MSAVNVSAISISFIFVSLVTNRVSLKECLPSFKVLNCLLNLAASCLDVEKEIPLKVRASFSVVRSVFWFMFSTNFFPFICKDAFLDVFIQS